MVDDNQDLRSGLKTKYFFLDGRKISYLEAGDSEELPFTIVYQGLKSCLSRVVILSPLIILKNCRRFY